MGVIKKKEFNELGRDEKDKQISFIFFYCLLLL